MRTFQPEVQALIERRLNELCSAVALGFGATATVHYERIYPGHHQFAGAKPTSRPTWPNRLVGADHVVRDMEPSMGAEDFSFMLQTKPGAYMRIGQGGEGSCFLHNSRYDFNDEILPLGSALHAGLIEQSMPLAGPDGPNPSSPIFLQGVIDEIQVPPALPPRCSAHWRRRRPGADCAHRQPGRRAVAWTRTRSTSRCS